MRGARTDNGAAPSAADEAGGTPSVVLDHLSVTYKVQVDKRRELRRVLVGNQSRRRRLRLVEAVQDVSVIVYPGQSVGVIGHNGSGKSTLLRTIAGLQPPTSGRVYAASLPVLLGVNAALSGDVSGHGNVYLGGTALGFSRAEMSERVGDILETAGLTEFADMPLRTYSSGMKARLNFAIATSTAPDILLIDESLGVGDEEFREQSEEQIQSLVANSGTVFIVSHKAGAILKMCNRVLWLDHGRLVADGEPEAVVSAYQRVMRQRRRQRRRRQRAARNGA
ncbi:MAG: ATP-binding cassette domain-containing protein [Actinobacteria bacterium]|nr:ATP-binding cassette domain-containing protein [Actinomycetota bacterium]